MACLSVAQGLEGARDHRPRSSSDGRRCMSLMCWRFRPELRAAPAYLQLHHIKLRLNARALSRDARLVNIFEYNEV